MKYTNFTAIAALSATLLLGLGCETSKSTSTTPQSQPTMAEEKPTPPPRQVRQNGWPTMRDGGNMVWSTMAYPTGSANTSVVGVEKGMPTEVRLNRPFDYQIVVTNLTSNELQDVVLMDSPDDALTINSSNPAGRANDDGMTWAIGDMAPRESRTIRISSTATKEGNVGSCVSVAYNSLLCSSVPVVSPKLKLEKDGPARILKCDPVEYTFTVTNTGSGTVRNVKINDPLPAGFQTESGARVLTFNVGDLRAGQSRTMNAVVEATRIGKFDNKATASGDGNINASSGTVSTTVVAPKLTIEHTCPKQQFINSNVNSSITVANTGEGEARDTILENVLPANARFVSASDGGRVVGGKIVWNLGTLGAKASKKVTYVIRPGAPGDYRNNASVDAFCADAVSDACSTKITGIPAILLEVVDLEDPVQVGSNTTYVITVTNQGSAPGTNITIASVLEANQEHVSNSGATRGDVRGQTIRFAPISSLAPGQKAVFRIVVKNVRAGDVRFTTTMNSDQLTREVRETEATNVYE